MVNLQDELDGVAANLIFIQNSGDGSFGKFTISQDGTNALHYHLHVDSPEDFDAIREMMEGYGGGQAANDGKR